MTILDAAALSARLPVTASARFNRVAFLLIVSGAAWAGAWFTSDAAARQAVAAAGADLTSLLRFMAVLKGAMAAAAAAAVLWRLGVPASPGRLFVYSGTAAIMVAGPGLIWQMAHVGWGALMLHGALAATLGILWFDPATAGCLEQTLRRRRQPARLSRRSRAARLRPDSIR